VQLTRVVALAFVGGMVGLASASPARAANREACFSAAESAQKLRAQGQLREARERLLVCAQTGCPGAVQADCTTWLTEVNAQLPSVVVQARDAAGADLSDVRVLVDGVPVADHLDGRPIELDPCLHVLRLEHAGAVSVERSLVLVEGQKARAVEAQMVPPSETASPRPPGKTIPVSVLTLGGVGALGLVSTAVFWVWGRSEYSGLQSSCSPACNPSSVAPVRTKLVVGDVSLGVAIVALGVGAGLFYLVRAHDAPSATVQSAELLVQPQPGGGVVGVGGRF
jgi:hypothetical protein